MLMACRSHCTNQPPYDIHIIDVTEHCYFDCFGICFMALTNPRVEFCLRNLTLIYPIAKKWEYFYSYTMTRDVMRYNKLNHITFISIKNTTHFHNLSLKVIKVVVLQGMHGQLICEFRVVHVHVKYLSNFLCLML